MDRTLVLLLFLYFVMIVDIMGKARKPLDMSTLTAKRDNPDFIRDRKKDEINKPQMPPTWGQSHHQPFDPAWMDYCDPYHCNDYFKIACGLNRRSMKFKWFQSTCHLILNNQCADFRGSLRYDLVESKFCQAYVMFLRTGCPTVKSCNDEEDVTEPVCAMSSIDGHVVLFKNQCLMEAANCRNSTLQEYDQVYMDICGYRLTNPK